MEWLFQKVKGDRVIWTVIILLSVFGVLAVYSSTGTLAYKKNGGNTEFYLVKHLGFLVLGLFLMYLSHKIDYRYYSRISQLMLWFSVPLLVYTLLFGSEINSASRWITVPGIGVTFQSSDLAKLALVMYVSRFLSKKQDDIKDFWKAFFPIIIAVTVICGLIVPANLSTASVLFATCLLLMFIGRIRFKYLISLVVIGIVFFSFVIGAIMFSGSGGRVQTWKNRLNTYFSSEEDGQGGSYQNQQAKIAIATGGFFGKLPGNSTQRNFLPSPYADFIYAIIIEEYGLVGGIVLVFLYLLLLFRCIRIVIRSPRAFGALLAVGLSFSLVIQAFINMGVAVNIFPVTGLSLPLVSMGGTSMIFTSIAFGIILSVSRDVEEVNEEGGENEAA